MTIPILGWQELICGDERGNLYFMNVLTDKNVLEFHLYDLPVLGVTVLANQSQLLVATQHFVDALQLLRGSKAANKKHDHRGPIIGLQAWEPAKITKGISKENPLYAFSLPLIIENRIISASLDNSLKVWDPRYIQCLNTLENKGKSEIMCLSCLPVCNLFVTGHENGDIKLWNVEIGNTLILDQSALSTRHTDAVCCFASGIMTTKRGHFEESSECLFSSGFDGRVNIWEMFEKKNFL